MKKLKHKMVENMEASTADALGLSRAILVNGKVNSISVMLTFVDSLVKKMDELNRTAAMFNGLVQHTRSLVRAIFQLSKVHRSKYSF